MTTINNLFSRYIIPILGLFLLLPLINYGQSTTVSGRIAGASGDSVVLFFFPQKFGWTNVGMIRLTTAADRENFRFELPPMEHPGQFTLGLMRGKKTLLGDEQWIEPGDSLVVQTDTSVAQLWITGKNAAKNQLQKSWEKWKRARISLGLNSEDAIVPFRYRDTREAWQHITGVHARHRSDWEQIAAPLREQIRDTLYKTLEADNKWDELQSLLVYTNYAWEKTFTAADRDNRQDSLKEYYNQQLEPALKKLLQQTNGNYLSPVFLDFAVRKTMTDARMQQNNLEAVEATQYLSFLDQWPLRVREWVASCLVSYLFTFTPNVRHSQELAKALSVQVKDPVLASRIRAYSLRFQPGTAIPPFKMKDEKGKTWTERELSSGTIVMDFWFNGCRACVQLQNALRKVKAELGDRKDIVFVSVNIDNDRDRWLSGLQSGLYTDPDNINLFTDGLAEEHPFVKHYEVTACPRLILFSKSGKLLTAEPPMGGGQVVTELKTLIEDASK